MGVEPTSMPLQGEPIAVMVRRLPKLRSIAVIYTLATLKRVAPVAHPSSGCTRRARQQSIYGLAT